VLDDFTVATFAPLVGDRFALEAEPGVSVDVRLAEATDHAADATARGVHRAPFSLVFAGPAEPILPQRTWPLEHPELGRFELFLVPVGRDAAGVRYEAVFG
jgi:hypothetical protein